MNKIRNYWKNKKGITLVWGAFFLVLLLILAGMAIDIGYMYVVKNQLQVAADSCCLAGVTQLDGTNSIIQGDVRNITVIFAGKNSAAGDSVVLASDGSNNLTDSNDITVGNWNRTADPKYLAGRIPINAIEVRARRTANSPGGPVSVFLGKIFRMLGADWSLMNASATATCTMPPRASSFVAVGDQFCPLPGDPTICVGGTGGIDGATCNLVTPRELFAEPTTVPDPEKMGWTSLLWQPGSTSSFETLMCGTSPYQDICPPASGIWGIPGTSEATFKDYKSLMCDSTFDSSSKEINPSGQVTGWEVLIPVVNRTDPMSAPDPNPVWGYAKIHIITICSPGSSGCRGAGSCIPSTFCTGGDKKIVVDRISCISCESGGLGLKPALVK